MGCGRVEFSTKFFLFSTIVDCYSLGRVYGGTFFLLFFRNFTIFRSIFVRVSKGKQKKPNGNIVLCPPITELLLILKKHFWTKNMEIFFLKDEPGFAIIIAPCKLCV